MRLVCQVKLSLIIFFIIQLVKARAIPSPHQPPTRGDKTFSVAQGSTATPGVNKQLLPPNRVFKRIIYIYIYINAISTIINKKTVLCMMKGRTLLSDKSVISEKSCGK